MSHEFKEETHALVEAEAESAWQEFTEFPEADRRMNFTDDQRELYRCGFAAGFEAGSRRTSERFMLSLKQMEALLKRL